MLLEGSTWGYKKITATFTSSRTGLSDVVIRTTKCTKAIASISSVVSRHATQCISLFSIAILKNETAVPIFRNDVRVVKSVQNRAPLRLSSITNLGWYVHPLLSKTQFLLFLFRTLWSLSPFITSSEHEILCCQRLSLFVIPPYFEKRGILLQNSREKSHSGSRAKCPKKLELHNPSVYHLRPGGVHFAANSPPYGSKLTSNSRGDPGKKTNKHTTFQRQTNKQTEKKKQYSGISVKMVSWEQGNGCGFRKDGKLLLQTEKVH